MRSIKLLKYSNEPVISLYGDRMAAIYGDVRLLGQDGNIISFKCGEMRIVVCGSGLLLAAITTPKTVIKGRIDRIELEKI